MKLIVITKACNWTCLNLQERWLTPSVTSEYQGMFVQSSIVRELGPDLKWVLIYLFLVLRDVMRMWWDIFSSWCRGSAFLCVTSIEGGDFIAWHYEKDGVLSVKCPLLILEKIAEPWMRIKIYGISFGRTVCLLKLEILPAVLPRIVWLYKLLDWDIIKSPVVCVTYVYMQRRMCFMLWCFFKLLYGVVFKSKSRNYMKEGTVDTYRKTSKARRVAREGGGVKKNAAKANTVEAVLAAKR